MKYTFIVESQNIKVPFYMGDFPATTMKERYENILSSLGLKDGKVLKIKKSSRLSESMTTIVTRYTRSGEVKNCRVKKCVAEWWIVTIETDEIYNARKAYRPRRANRCWNSISNIDTKKHYDGRFIYVLRDSLS